MQIPIIILLLFTWIVSANVSDTPSFQSFNDWKKDKLSDDNNRQHHTGGGSKILNSPIRQNRMKTRSNNDNAGGDDNDEEHIGEMMIELSMFTGENDDNNNNNVNNDKTGLGKGIIEKDIQDDGKLYKDRFNFASFDCAATIIKTNKEAKGANAVLLDNKDSYLLNECSAINKFIIIELCEDILVDEVLIANYEFYSSMFKEIRISASDRFPVNQWIILGEFTSENVRKLQNFKINNPIIWTKFLRIEFLSHYGDEFYCPISSIQVHGKTMIEQLKEEEEVSVSDEDEKIEGDIIERGPLVNFEINQTEMGNSNDKDNNETNLLTKTPIFDVDLFNSTWISCIEINDTMKTNCSTPKYLKLDEFLKDYEKRNAEYGQCFDNNTNNNNNNDLTTTILPSIKPQDSIYKNIVKRLNLLESNATLSLLYIEEQSKLLSESFINLENNQNIKFQNILHQLNSTIQNQMNTFDKLNTDVYNSFAKLFEFQQQNFDNTNNEINKELKDLKRSIWIYRNLTILTILLVITVISYKIITRDIIIFNDKEWNFPTSPDYSPSVSPIISRKSSVAKIYKNDKHKYPNKPVLDDINNDDAEILFEE